MEYDTPFQQAAMQRPIEAQRFDLAALTKQLEHCVERADAAGYRIQGLADNVLGPRPENAGSAGIAQSPPPSLAWLVEQLSNALGRIEDGLDRL